MEVKNLHRRKRKAAWGFTGFIILIIVVRLILPYVVLHLVNKNLATMKGYYGHVQDIDLSIIRGAYKIDSIYLNKKDTLTLNQTPFFAASIIDLSVEWKALFRGSIVGEVVLNKPMLRFTKDKVEPKDVARDSSALKKLLDDFMPLQINRCEVNQGRILYIDQGVNPPVDLQMTNVHILAENLRNSYDSTIVLPATVNADATIYEGKLTFHAKANPLANDPTFDMSAELKNTNLVKLNNFFQAYAKIDVNKGSFGLYTEVAAKDKKFAGYVKPFLKDLDVLGKEDRRDNLLRKMWEGLVGTVGVILKNQKKDQIATKIPFQGNLDSPRTNVWYALANILQNAFIHALQPSIDNDISISSVRLKADEKKTFLQKIFSKDDKEKDDKDKNKKKIKRSKT
ncbi:DUF748 domain-containing protein [Dyadobacter frigoris]|uniref:DUF748 domain-containing protein n=1 Tax=Dyadobacter frigoris TaxID=2576211 RepID=A0A4U6D0Y8_9BACT|nr:DUF748 domain-containing protein [Dyadobacter frigoris]TKT90772.1 DUF748 domain-containing protein [Dyadobacter frigoris]GLU52107.1 hypothetical protein Dfri01_15680 [Dyadobacter frigoris]